MKTLNLTLKKKWFDMVASGDKTEEYREIKQYWINRFTWHEHHREVSCYESLMDAFENDSTRGWLSDGVIRQDFDLVTFRNGYSKNSPTMTFECKGIEIREG